MRKKPTEEGRRLFAEMQKIGEEKRKNYQLATEQARIPNGFRYGVIRSSGSSMKFNAIHETFEQAEAQAISLLAQSVQNNDHNPLFSIVKIEKSFLFDGKEFKEVV